MAGRARSPFVLRRHLLPVVAAVLAAAALVHAQPTRPVAPQAAWGMPAEAGAARRAIRITMADEQRCAPAIIEVGHGETVRLEVHNAGQLPRDFVLGARAVPPGPAAAAPRRTASDAAAPGTLRVGPGQAGSLAWHFNRTGEFPFACRAPGSAAGLGGVIRVVEPAGHKH